ncbi:MAG: sel1 repeat family protein [Deltaproteobacteria bacterium]|jgi:hypothetical protein|nr:sel1 repeat family protein [Deltaproteobacteria bacterium]
MINSNNNTSPESLFEAGKKFYFPNQHNAHDPDLALQYFQKAAEQGYTPAQRLYGICLLEGNFCAKDLKNALLYLTKAAEKHDPQASYTLALMYARGEGVPKDWAKAFELLAHPQIQNLSEARALKIKLKQELIAQFPNLISALDREENMWRSRLKLLNKRSFPHFFGKMQGDMEEFHALLDLNLRKRSPEEVFKHLKDLMDKYYEGA